LTGSTSSTPYGGPSTNSVIRSNASTAVTRSARLPLTMISSPTFGE
jgi:hypothetical protein